MQAPVVRKDKKIDKTMVFSTECTIGMVEGNFK